MYILDHASVYLGPSNISWAMQHILGHANVYLWPCNQWLLEAAEGSKQMKYPCIEAHMTISCSHTHVAVGHQHEFH